MAGVEPLRIHDLRHTAASLMLSSGMPIAMVSRQLGHASVSTTDLIYGGLLRDFLDTAVDEFGEWYTRQAKIARQALQGG
jgi:integrase